MFGFELVQYIVDLYNSNIEYQEELKPISLNDGVGIDLGIKDFTVCSDKNIYKNINKIRKEKT